MGRPRIHPRRYYRATDSGFYVDQATGDELEYHRNVTILPDKQHNMSFRRQEALALKLVEFGVFEPMDEMPEVIERITEAPTSIEE